MKTKLNPQQFENLDNKLIHLSAMLTVIHGPGAESFHQYTAQVQDDYIFACHAVVEECREALHSLIVEETVA